MRGLAQRTRGFSLAAVLGAILLPAIHQPVLAQVPARGAIDFSDFRPVFMGGNWGTNKEGVTTMPAEYFDFLRSIRANWVGISVALHVADSLDSTVERRYSGVFIPTFTDTFLRNLIRRFRTEGFQVYLTLAFEDQESSTSVRPVSRWQLGDTSVPGGVSAANWPWSPSHANQAAFVSSFWNTYTQQAVHFGEIAAEEGVGLYSLGTETDRLFRTRTSPAWPNEFRTQIQNMTAAVRQVYPRTLTYDMHYAVLTDSNVFGPALDMLWQDAGLDMIGVSAYFPLFPAPVASIPTAVQLETRWRQIFDAYLTPLHNRNPQLPIVFLEFGYTDSTQSPATPNSQEGVTKVVGDSNGNSKDDGEETQSAIYQALFNVMDENPGLLRGAFLWDIMMAGNQEYANSSGKLRGFNVRGKLAESVVRVTFGKWRPAPPIVIEPNPPHLAVEVPLNPVLSWGRNATAESYDVRFGSSLPIPLAGNTTGGGFTPNGPLLPGTTYFWSVTPKNSKGQGLASLWEFLTACTYSLSPTAITMPAAGGPRVFSVITQPACFWQASPNAAWITMPQSVFTPYFEAAPNASAQSRTGTISIAGQTLTVTQRGVGTIANPAPEVAESVPAFGSGASQTFQFAFRDENGAGDLAVLNALIYNVLDGRQSCYIAFVPSGPAAGSVFLVNDAGDAGGPFAGSIVVPGTGTASNSQCTISASGANVLSIGDTLLLNLPIAFKTAFNGDRILYLAARDKANHGTGWRAKGVWTVPGGGPAAISVAGLEPSRATTRPVTFTARFSDNDGFADLDVVNLLINDAIDGRNACYLAFVRSTSTLFLVNNAGDAGGPFAGSLKLPGTGSIANSQCTIAGTGSSVSGAGSTLTLTLNVTFKAAFAGDRTVYTAARDAAAHNTGWRAKGTVTVP
ncbi:MAG: BACON domain-containing carbohydrate-binding protein [Bryobacteraceae bacterium]